MILRMTGCRFVVALLLLLTSRPKGLLLTLGLAPNNSNNPTTKACSCHVGRRQAISGAAAAAWMGCFGIKPPAAHAFANKISNKYDDRPKRRGPKPKDLGVSMRTSLEGDEYLGLKPCGAAPNCFCSTMEKEEDPDHSIPPWIYPSRYETKQQAMDELLAVLQAYQPGQSGVDGGGFEVQTVRPDYIYVQFEALKNGYLDDFEAAILSNSEPSSRVIQIRSSSRIGYLDFGVNAKRVNYIAKELRAKGWEAEGVDFQTHAGYALENQI